MWSSPIVHHSMALLLMLGALSPLTTGYNVYVRQGAASPQGTMPGCGHEHGGQDYGGLPRPVAMPNGPTRIYPSGTPSNVVFQHRFRNGHPHHHHQDGQLINNYPNGNRQAVPGQEQSPPPMPSMPINIKGTTSNFNEMDPWPGHHIFSNFSSNHFSNRDNSPPPPPRNHNHGNEENNHGHSDGKPGSDSDQIKDVSVVETTTTSESLNDIEKFLGGRRRKRNVLWMNPSLYYNRAIGHSLAGNQAPSNSDDYEDEERVQQNGYGNGGGGRRNSMNGGMNGQGSDGDDGGRISHISRQIIREHELSSNQRNNPFPYNMNNQRALHLIPRNNPLLRNRV